MGVGVPARQEPPLSDAQDLRDIAGAGCSWGGSVPLRCPDLSQTEPDLALVLVDDGSKDATPGRRSADAIQGSACCAAAEKGFPALWRVRWPRASCDSELMARMEHR